VARWNGQTRGPHIFSVAQHSLLVEAIGGELEPDLTAADRLALLLHDAPGIRDRRHHLAVQGGGRGRVRSVEARLLAAIHLRFGLKPECSAELRRRIKRADRIAAFHEATRLAAFERDEALRLFGRPGPLPRAVEPCLAPWPIAESQERYLARVAALQKARAPA
jgi:5'-deoxynucleotidase YfbR-like HD superfamily hydrolase